MPTVRIGEIENLGKKGRVLDPIPKDQTQQGPNCGFYALSIVLEYWKTKGKISQTLPARKRDIAAGTTQTVFSNDTADPKSLRQLGKQKGALNIRENLNAPTEKPNASVGGVFRAAQLGDVAKAFNQSNL
jgi:hypothetical protein